MTLQEQLAQAIANYDKAETKWLEAEAGRLKADIDYRKADEEVERIQELLIAPVDSMKPWVDFNRFRGSDSFYGCVAPDGTWFDSAIRFEIAVHWCAYAAGEFELSPEQEMEWMSTKGRDLGYSIIHSSMLERMYEKELLK
jgi:hypothetical protein